MSSSSRSRTQQHPPSGRRRGSAGLLRPPGGRLPSHGRRGAAASAAAAASAGAGVVAAGRSGMRRRCPPAAPGAARAGVASGTPRDAAARSPRRSSATTTSVVPCGMRLAAQESETLPQSVRVDWRQRRGGLLHSPREKSAQRAHQATTRARAHWLFLSRRTGVAILDGEHARRGLAARRGARPDRLQPLAARAGHVRRHHPQAQTQQRCAGEPAGAGGTSCGGQRPLEPRKRKRASPGAHRNRSSTAETRSRARLLGGSRRGASAVLSRASEQERSDSGAVPPTHSVSGDTAEDQGPSPVCVCSFAARRVRVQSGSATCSSMSRCTRT